MLRWMISGIINLIILIWLKRIYSEQITIIYL